MPLIPPASATRDYIFLEFCVEDSKDVNVSFEKSKLAFSLPPLPGSVHLKHFDLFHCIDCLRKGKSGQSWPTLTKERVNLNWLSVDFSHWKDCEDYSDEAMSDFDRFSENNMGGEEDVDLPDGADDHSQDSENEKMPDLE
uniref:CS domain-containing protein n=1 Tax=Cebus imitator TaxID=2715852 RepID=A0A2K5S114_CEBIM